MIITELALTEFVSIGGVGEDEDKSMCSLLTPDKC